MADLLDVLKGAATVALIAFAVGWLTTAKGSDSPKIHGEVSVYGIRWPLRAVAYAAAVLCLVFTFVDMRWPVKVLFAVFALGAACFGTGAVTSDKQSISKRFLWHSSSLKWDEISEVRLHKRCGGAIELRGSGRRLIVDSRFVAPTHLQHEIYQSTKLQPLTD